MHAVEWVEIRGTQWMAPGYESDGVRLVVGGIGVGMRGYAGR